MKRVVLLTMALAFTALTTACNTVEGAGQDIQKGGRSVERAADENK